MFKKIGLPVIALLGILAMAPHLAKAAVRFGVVVGRPAYAYPAYPVYPPAVVVERPWVRHEFRRDWDDRDSDRRDWDRHDWDRHDWDRRDWGRHDRDDFRYRR